MQNQPTTSATTEKTKQVVSAAAAVRRVADGDTVATGGFVGIGLPKTLLLHWKTFSWRRSAKRSRLSRNLTLFYAAGRATARIAASITGA